MHLNPINKNIASHPDFFYILGVLEGDGHLGKDKKSSSRINFFKINVCDFEIVNTIKIIFNLYSPETNITINKIKSRGNAKKQYVIKFYSKEFFEQGLHLIKPKTIEQKRFYLRGLYDTEGSVGIYKRKGFKKWLNLYQKDTTKLDLWSEYLAEFGIESHKEYSKTGRSYISIRNLDSINLFKEFINFNIHRKSLTLHKIILKKYDIEMRQHLKTKIFEKAKRLYQETNLTLPEIAKLLNYDYVSIWQTVIRKNKLKKSINISKKIDMEMAELIFTILKDDYFEIPTELPFDVMKLPGIPKNKPISYRIPGKNKLQLKFKKITSITFSHKEKGVDLITPKYGNFFLSNDILSHNSTMAQQIAYFLAWLVAGGKMEQRDDGRWVVGKKPEKPVNFNIEDNIVFSPEDLMKKASTLFKKYGKHQVIVYDEGRAGLDSARAMQAINKAMQDFFQECDQYGHMIIIVLPSFFKLHEDYATSRSLFLVDVFADKNLTRGHFNFYTERQKEYLYLNGKKRVGTLAKYAGCHHSFAGRFTKFLPVPDDEYNKAKAKALKKKDLTRTDRKWKQQRDAALYIIRRETGKTYTAIAREMTVLCGFPISEKMMRFGIQNITKEKDNDD